MQATFGMRYYIHQIDHFHYLYGFFSLSGTMYGMDCHATMVYFSGGQKRTAKKKEEEAASKLLIAQQQEEIALLKDSVLNLAQYKVI